MEELIKRFELKWGKTFNEIEGYINKDHTLLLKQGDFKEIKTMRKGRIDEFKDDVDEKNYVIIYERGEYVLLDRYLYRIARELLPVADAYFHDYNYPVMLDGGEWKILIAPRIDKDESLKPEIPETIKRKISIPDIEDGY